MKDNEIGKKISVVSSYIDQFIDMTAKDEGITVSDREREVVRYCLLLSLARAKAETSGDKSWLEAIEYN